MHRFEIEEGKINAFCLYMETTFSIPVCWKPIKSDEDLITQIADNLITYIIKRGAPKEIHASNILIAYAIDSICKICDIKIKIVNQLPAYQAGIEDIKRRYGYDK